jgi:hypothetical protein
MAVFGRSRWLAVAALLLSGCTGCTPASTTMFEVPYTGIVVAPPDFATAHFATAAEVVLRAGEDDESRPVAVLPRGTPVVPIGSTGGESEAWRVDTPSGAGWLYTRYIVTRNEAAE